MSLSNPVLTGPSGGRTVESGHGSSAATTVEAKLLTLRRAGSHLFARYQLPTGQAPGDG